MNPVRSSMPSVGLLAVVAVLLAGDMAVRTVRAQPQAGGRVVIAQEFRLIDGQGNPRADLAIQPDGGPGLAFIDKQGKPRASIGLTDDQSAFALYDADGHTRVRITLQRDGSAGISLHDKNQKQRAALRLQADGIPLLTLNDADGKNRAALETEMDGSPSLSLTNKDGKGGAALLIHEGDPVSIFKNKEGKVIWTAPGPEIELKP